MDFLPLETSRQLAADRRARFLRDAARPFHPPVTTRARTRTTRIAARE